MSIMDNARTLGSNINTLSKAPLMEYKSNYKYRKSIDDIKEAYYKHANRHIDFFNNNEYVITNKMTQSAFIKSFYEETNEFFDENIRTAILKTLVQKISSKVVDKIEVLDSSDEVVENITFKEGINFPISKDEFNNIAQSIMLYDKVFIKVNVSEQGTFELEIKEPFKVSKGEDLYDFPFFKGDEEYIERRLLKEGKYFTQVLTKDKKGKFNIIDEQPIEYNQMLVYELDTDIELIKNGLLEIIGIYTQTFSSLQKEMVTSSAKIFSDKSYLNYEGYNFLRESYIPVNTPDTSTELGADNKPLFEVYQPDIRDTSFTAIIELLKDEMSSILQMDRSSIGLDTSLESATSTVIKKSQTADTINSIKVAINQALNGFIQEFISEDYKVIIPPYQSKDDEYTINNIKNATNTKMPFITLSTAVKMLHPDWTVEQQEIETLTLMYQSATPFTREQEERARELNILPELPQTEGNIEPIL